MCEIWTHLTWIIICTFLLSPLQMLWIDPTKCESDDVSDTTHKTSYTQQQQQHKGLNNECVRIGERGWWHIGDKMGWRQQKGQKMWHPQNVVKTQTSLTSVHYLHIMLCLSTEKHIVIMHIPIVMIINKVELTSKFLSYIYKEHLWIFPITRSSNRQHFHVNFHFISLLS